MKYVGKFSIYGDKSKIGDELTLDIRDGHGHPYCMVMSGENEIGAVPDAFLRKINRTAPYKLEIVNEYDSPQGKVLELSYSIMSDRVPLYANKTFWKYVLFIAALAFILVAMKDVGIERGWW